ncbi:MAG: hypothetical protein DWQ29_01810 [Planctomycetota bacterium]|nr:MAG: hypothetical protein DWQ29_01810 [Planctomycetota bacterium]
MVERPGWAFPLLKARLVMRSLQSIAAMVVLSAVAVFFSTPGGVYSEEEAVEVVAEAAEAPSELSTPVMLDFEVDEGNDIGFTVLCASGDYRVSVDNSDPDGETHVEVSGTVRSMNQGGLLLTFEAQIHHASLAEGEEFTFSAEGSAVLLPGEREALATSPGPGLYVTMQEAGE